MKKVDLVNYFEMGELLYKARQSTGFDKSTIGDIWFSLFNLPEKLSEFVSDDNGFSTCKHVANELAETVSDWITKNVFGGDIDQKIITSDFSNAIERWQYGYISNKIDEFKNVFRAECKNIDVYSVGEISIYNTSKLVGNGSHFIPLEIRSSIPDEILSEFDNSGRCLAFDLPTACGFHALRGLELVMEIYIGHFSGRSKNLRSWNDYIREIQKLVDDDKCTMKPSAKVAAMLDRMRELERNPLMHPRDSLDSVQADMLFRLCAITLVEMVRDMLLTSHIIEQATKPLDISKENDGRPNP